MAQADVVKFAAPDSDSQQELFHEIGRSGVKQWGGILDEEFLRELRGTSGIKVYREMSRNDAVVGASLFAYTTLAKEVSFRVDSAKAGDRIADEIAEFVRGALFDDLSLSWRDLLSEIFSFLTYGWSWFEIVYKRRGGWTNDPTTRSKFNDNRIGFRKWAVRGQETLERWNLDPAGGVQGMIQRAAPTYEVVEIPISRSLLFRTSLERGSPEGMSILRTSYTPWYHKRRLQVVRGIGIERDLAGMPILTPPQGINLWNTKDSEAATLKTQAEKIVRNVRRDEHEGIVMPYGWKLELLASAGGGRQFNITEVVAQLNAEIAMSMMTDFVLVGHEKVGARAVSESKQGIFGHAAGSFLDGIADVINRFAIPSLLQLNGLPLELSPRLEHGPVAEISLADLTSFIEKTASAGLLFPDPGLEKYLRRRAQLPPPEETRIPVSERTP